MVLGEGHVGQDVGLGRVQEGGELGHAGPQLIGDLTPLGLGRGLVVLGEGGADEGRDHPALGFAGMDQGVAHEVHATPLPGRAEHARDSGLDAFVGVGDHQLHSAQAAPGQLAQELDPERGRLGDADVHAQHLAPAITVDPHGDDHRHRDDASVLAHLQIGGVNPDIGPVALDRPAQEGLDPLVDLLAKPRHLALGDAAHAHGLDQIVH